MSTPPTAVSRLRGVIGAAAVILAVAGLASLGAVLALSRDGGSAAAVFVWFPMFALPAAFILLGISLVAAVRRRRRL